MEILVIFLLTLVNGFFSLSEIALVSVKESRIQALADRGGKRARTILTLLANPESFLSSVQVGITLIGIISADRSINTEWAGFQIDKSKSAPVEVPTVVIVQGARLGTRESLEGSPHGLLFKKVAFHRNSLFQGRL